MRGVDVYGHGPNNDGCDPESVRPTCSSRIAPSTPATTASRSTPAATPTAGALATPSQNIVVRNCRMKDGHGGVIIGSKISGGVR